MQDMQRKGNMTICFQVTGPIDFQQLQLENAELIDVLREKNTQVINGRRAISDTRKIKNKIRTKLEAEQSKAASLKKQIAENSDKWIPRLQKSLSDLRVRVKSVKNKKADQIQKCDEYLKGMCSRKR